MKQILVLAVTAFTALLQGAPARAEVVGHWATETGQVQMLIDNQDQGTAPCSLIQFDTSMDASSLNIEQLTFECGAMLYMHMEPQSFEIRNGALFRQDTEIGTLTASSIEFLIKDANRQGSNLLKVKETEKGLEFLDTWTDGYTTLIFTGMMARK